jgi:hypothetical protein
LRKNAAAAVAEASKKRAAGRRKWKSSSKVARRKLQSKWQMVFESNYEFNSSPFHGED